jgi:Tfp pilus assembly protein PilN
MPELFEKIKKALPQGMMVDEFTFKTGQPIKIRGFCPNYDMLYKFQQGLSDVKGIKNVNILSPRMDQKNNRLEYSMVFDYKDFTRKAK